MSESRGFNDFLQSHEGIELMKKHKLQTYGKWMIRGGDSNCDYGGIHYMPVLGYYEGRLEDVIKFGVELKNFWSWGPGDFTLIDVKKVPDAAMRKELLRQQVALQEQLDEVNRKLAL